MTATATATHARLRDPATVDLSAHRLQVTISDNWNGPFYVGPALFIPPVKEDCRCACSATDRYGRPVHIGLCGPDCERRPR